MSYSCIYLLLNQLLPSFFLNNPKLIQGVEETFSILGCKIECKI